MSVNKLIRSQGKILDDILQHCRENLSKVMEDVPEETLRAFLFMAPPTQEITKIFAPTKTIVIGECKKATPTRGMIARHYDPTALAKVYIRGGARAVTIWTDRRHFQGHLTHLRNAREHMSKSPPILIRYDFIFHPYQIYESRVAGADGVILIAKVVGGSKKLRELMELCYKLNMTPLIEVHTPEELQQVLPLTPPILVINNRDWQTYNVDLGITSQLRPLVPAGIPVVSTGGIKTTQQLELLRQTNVDGVMIGEAFVRHRQPLDIVRTFVETGKKKKLL